jgi:serine/threonine protein kinase
MRDLQPLMDASPSSSVPVPSAEPLPLLRLIRSRMAELQENMVVANRFRLVKMIGRGGMGSVWQAMHLGLDTPCAVKFIEGELANMAEAHQRFEREAKAAAQLRSPNVVQIFDHGVWEGRPYIAMELLEGEDLGKRLARRGGKLSPPEVNFVVQEVCRALTRAHQAGVVHRDLKPDNVFIVKDDERDIVKILDFGVAKSAAALDGSNTKTGAMLGTPYYMSPEQAQGIKSVDARSDLWSLAVIVFQCLTGRLPFESEALGDLLVKIIVNKVPTPSEYNPMVPIGFDGWWAKASERPVENRYPTAKAFSESLSIALGQSANTDVTERGRLNRNTDRPGGATAMMVNGPGTEVYAHVPNTPQPGVQTAHMHMQTPNPMHTPPGMHGSQPGAGGSGQQGAQHGGPPMGPPQGHPHHQSQPGYMQGAPQNTTGNPVANTYSGMDGNGVPKKSPVALFVGIGAVIALVGLGLGGVALVRGRSTSGPIVDPATANGSATASASQATAAADPSSAPVAKAAETPPVIAAADAGADPAAKDPATPATSATVAAVPANGGVHHGSSNGGGHAPAGGAAKPATPLTPPATPVAAPAKPPGTQKPINLGF